ncbi:MAG: AraC family ligand binding domain-containing protein, partial [Lachnospiraceae bacterium]|nr:AraC family ligand binding domain-containing protein [Lachnospiraceae bacterium]
MANNKIPLNAQYFCRDVDKRRKQETTGEGPKLLYVGMTSASAGTCPRIMHAHSDLLEFMLITEGEADFFVDDRMHHVSSGDLLIYNAGVVHDEFPGKNTNISSYYVAVQNTCFQGTADNTLAPQEKGCIYKTGEDFEDLHILL